MKVEIKVAEGSSVFNYANLENVGLKASEIKAKYKRAGRKWHKRTRAADKMRQAADKGTNWNVVYALMAIAPNLSLSGAKAKAIEITEGRQTK